MTRTALKLFPAVAVVSLAAGLTCTVAQPAHAAGSCTLNVPHRISMVGTHREISASFGADCKAAGVTDGSALWVAYQKDASQEGVGAYDKTFPLWNTDATGVWTWKGEQATDGNGAAVTQNSPVSDVRPGTASYIQPSRKGKMVTLRSHAMVYSPVKNAMVPYRGAGVFQMWDTTKSTWVAIKMISANAEGWYWYTFTSAQPQAYRVVTADSTAVAWGSSSPAVTV